jgi:hypothetical protein
MLKFVRSPNMFEGYLCRIIGRPSVNRGFLVHRSVVTIETVASHPEASK